MKDMMMKSALALVAVLAIGHSAFAGGTDTIADEQEMSDEAIAQLSANEPMAIYQDDQGNTEVGSILGGIIGAVEADHWHPGPHRPHYVTCYAQSRNGRIFRAVGWNPRQAQKQALFKCIQHARFCRALGCR